MINQLRPLLAACGLSLLAACDRTPAPQSGPPPPIKAVEYIAGCGLWGCAETWIMADGKMYQRVTSPGAKPSVEVRSGTVPPAVFLKIARLCQSEPLDNVSGRADGSNITDVSTDTLQMRMADGSKRSISAYGGTENRGFNRIAEQVTTAAQEARGVKLVYQGEDTTWDPLAQP